MGSKCTELTAVERLRILSDFYHGGNDIGMELDIEDTMKKGHDIKDAIAPASFAKHSDYFEIDGKFGRVVYLKDYASGIDDSMITSLTDFNRNMMLSIDIIPVPTDEAVREVESRLLGVETNIVIIVQPFFIEKHIRSCRQNIFCRAICPAQLLQ